jgi:hypothetical protein
VGVDALLHHTQAVAQHDDLIKSSGKAE